MTPSENPSARGGLERLLLALPLAAREGGADIEDLAGELGVEPRRVLEDLKEVESRSYYLPAGLGDQIQLTVTPERLDVWTTGEFQRPVRLNPREALALELALRVRARPTAAGEEPGEEGEVSFDALRERVVEALRTPAAEEGEAPEVALGGAEAGSDPLRETVQRAVHEGRALELLYRPPGREAEEREVGPILLAHAEGRWYLLARDLAAGGQRAYRMDRVVEARESGEEFVAEAEDEEAVERFFQDGRIHDASGPDAPEPFEAAVVYSPGIARWIREHGWENAEELPDGGLRVRHRVLDPEWLLRHVLSYGPDAEILEPEWMRERLVSVVEGMTGTGGDEE